MRLRFEGGPYDGQTMQLSAKYVQLFDTTVGCKHKFGTPSGRSVIYKVIKATKTEVVLRFVSEVQHNYTESS